ncbi:MAG: hypothetical protein FJ240_07630 [Nitrospira sp.]|nr:hypothetical protein [Nitrospira sp.]
MKLLIGNPKSIVKSDQRTISYLVKIVSGLLAFCSFTFLLAAQSPTVLAQQHQESNKIESLPSLEKIESILEVSSGSYLDEIGIRNFTQNNIDVDIKEYIDDELCRMKTTQLKPSEKTTFFPAGWEEQQLADHRKTYVIPRTDKTGLHKYRIVVSSKGNNITVEKSMEFLVKERVLNVARVRQEGYLWCWAASGAAILNYLGRAVYPCDLVNLFLLARDESKVNCCVDREKKKECFPKVSGTGWRIFTGPRTVDIYRKHGLSYTHHDNPLSPQEIYDEINQNRPFMIGLAVGNDGHTSVGRGYRRIYDGLSESNRYRTYVHVMDPKVYPLYFLQEYESAIGDRAQYAGMGGVTWVDSATDLKMDVPILVQSGWLELPKTAIAGIPFEARIQGLSNEDYVVEWFSPSNNLKFLTEIEIGRSSEWAGETPGNVLIGARVYSNKTKTELVAQKEPKQVLILARPKPVLSIEGYDRGQSDIVIPIAIDDPKFGLPITVLLNIRTSDGRTNIIIDYEKINLQPTWHAVDENGKDIPIERADNITAYDMMQGIYKAKASPPKFSGQFTFWATLEDHENKVLSTSNKITITYSTKCMVTIKGPSEGEAGKQIDFSAEVTADEAMKKSIQLEWSIEGQAGSIGKGMSIPYIFKDAGTYKLIVVAYLKVGDKEFKVAEDDHIITVRKKSGDETLKVTINPENIKIKEDEYVDLSASVEPYKNSGKLSFYWSDYPEATEKTSFRFHGKDAKQKPPVRVTVNVRVKDEKGREGEAIANITVDAKAGVKETGKLSDALIDSASKDWKRLIELKDEANKLKPPDEEAIKKINAALFTLAEESQQYLRDCLNYFVVLKEKDRIAFAELKKGVNGSLTRECHNKEMCPCNPDMEECWKNCCAEYVNQSYFRCLSDAEIENSKNQKTIEKKATIIKESRIFSNYADYKAAFPDRVTYTNYFTDLEKLKGSLSLPDPLPGHPVLSWSYGSPCGGAVGIDPTSSGGLEVSLSQLVVAPPLKPGGKVKITATVKGGRAPYKYSWSGTPEGSGESVTYTLKTTGDNTIIVDVIDMGNLRGTGKITVKVEGVEGEIKGLAGSAVFGTVLPIAVSVKGILSEDAEKQKPAAKRKWKTYEECFSKPKPSGNMPSPNCEDNVYDENCQPVCIADIGEKGEPTSSYRVVWQSDQKGIEFDPSTSYDFKTKVLLSRMGKIKIWAEIQKATGEGVYSTVGDTPQKEITVVPPKFRWSFVPDKGKGKVGEEVRATITTEPKIDPKVITFKWDYPESSNRMEYETNSSVIGFVPKDPKPMMLLVSPQVPFYGDRIGGALKEEYQAGAYVVILSEPHYLGEKPKIWECDTQLGGKCPGLVEVSDQQFAVGFNIIIDAKITPDLPKEYLRYKWTIQPDGFCGIPGSGDQLTMNCGSTGNYTVTIVISDDKGIQIGTASRQVNVTIDQKTLNDSKKKAAEAAKGQEDKEEAQKKLNQALEMLRQGKLDEAIRLAEEAAKLDKKLAEPVMKQISQECKKLGWDGIYEREFRKGIGLLEAAVRLNPADKNAQDKLDKAMKFEKIWPQVEQKAQEFKNLIAGKKVNSAYKKYQEIQDLQQEMPGQIANKFSRDLFNLWDEANKEYNQFLQDSQKKNQEYFDAMDWEGLIAHAQEVLKREHSGGTRKDWEAILDLAKNRITEREQAWNYYLSVKEVFEKRNIKQATDMLRDLKDKPQFFMKNDPRRKEILDLIAAIEQSHITASAKEYAMNLFRAGEQQLREYHYEQAAAAFKNGLKAMSDHKLTQDPDYAKYYKLHEEAMAKDKRMKELYPFVQSNANATTSLPKETIEKALSGAKELIALQPNNNDFQYFKNALEQKLKNMQESMLKGQQLWDEGKSLLNSLSAGYDPLGALAKFKESIKYLPIPEHIRYVQDLETKIKQKQETAKKLRIEGDALFKQNKISEALAKYRESTRNWHDADLEKYVREMENRKITADKLWEDGRAFYDQNKWTDALTKFKESLTYWPDPVRQDYVRKMEAAKASAKKLRDEGEALQNQGRLQDAVNRYKQSVKTWPNPALEEHIVKVENEIINIACAKKNRDEGTALEQQGRLREALEKYRESYNCKPTPEMAQHIKKIEIAIATLGMQYVKGFEGKWNSNWGVLELRVEGTEVYGNYTHDSGKINATLSTDNKTMAGEWKEAPSYKPPHDGGKVTFTLSPDGETITGKWGYGDNLNAGDWTGTRIKDTTPPPPTDLFGSGKSFKITRIDYPSQVASNGPKGDLRIYWSGNPSFPVKVVYRPKSCPSGIVCTTPSTTIDSKQNPLVFPQAIWCGGSAKDIYFDYEVVITDVSGTETAPYPASFTCKGSQ